MLPAPVLAKVKPAGGASTGSWSKVRIGRADDASLPACWESTSSRRRAPAVAGSLTQWSLGDRSYHRDDGPARRSWYLLHLLIVARE